MYFERKAYLKELISAEGNGIGITFFLMRFRW